MRSSWNGNVYALAMAESAEAAQTVIAGLNRHEESGETLQASEAVFTRGQEDAGIEVYVGNVHPDVTEGELTQLFSPYGELLSTEVVLHKDGTSKGFAFVRFASAEHAAEAIRQVNGVPVLGRPLEVGLADKRWGWNESAGYATGKGGKSRKGKGKGKGAQGEGAWIGTAKQQWATRSTRRFSVWSRPGHASSRACCSRTKRWLWSVWLTIACSTLDSRRPRPC